MNKRPLRLALVLAGLAMASTAHASQCTLDGVVLNCTGANDMEILASFASDETGKLFGDPLELIDEFERPIQLEQFRRSVEKNWRRVNRAERAQRQKMKRRIISADEFEAWSASYEAAVENYDAALKVYRTLVWHGKSGRKVPKG
ncbi:MAG: hypothetical protein AAF412_10990 [Pseudomonadota bacterium]